MTFNYALQEKAAHRLGTALVAGGTFGNAAAQWLIVFMFARAAGPEAVGRYSLLLAVATPIFVFCQYGLRNVYLTFQENHSFREYCTLRIAGCILGVIAVIGVGSAFELDLPTVIAMCALKVADSWLDLEYGRLQRRGSIRRLGISMLANPILTVSLVTCGVLLSHSVAVGVAASAIASVASIAIVRFGNPEGSSGPAAERARSSKLRVLQIATPVMFAQLASAVLAYLPIWIVGVHGNEREIGIYAGASYLLIAANLAGSSIATVEISRYRRNRDAGGSNWRMAITSSFRIIAVGVLLSVPVVALGPWVLAMTYGSSFEMSRVNIAILAAAAVVTAPAYLLNSVLLVENTYGSQGAIAAVAVLASMAMGVWLAGSDVIGPVTAGTITALIGATLRLTLPIPMILSRIKRGRPCAE